MDIQGILSFCKVKIAEGVSCEKIAEALRQDAKLHAADFAHPKGEWTGGRVSTFLIEQGIRRKRKRVLEALPPIVVAPEAPAAPAPVPPPAAPTPGSVSRIDAARKVLKIEGMTAEERLAIADLILEGGAS